MAKCISTKLAAALLMFGLFATSLNAHFIETFAVLNGANAGTGSTATGTAQVLLDMDLITMRVIADFSGLSGNSVAANVFVPIPPAGPGSIIANVPSLLAFPAGVTAGTYDQTFDLTVAGSYNPAFITAAGGTVADALEALHDAVDANTAFFTVTSTAFGGGEISGTLFVVPEPTSMTLFGLTGTGLFIRRRLIRRVK